MSKKDRTLNGLVDKEGGYYLEKELRVSSGAKSCYVLEKKRYWPVSTLDHPCDHCADRPYWSGHMCSLTLGIMDMHEAIIPKRYITVLLVDDLAGKEAVSAGMLAFLLGQGKPCR